MKKRAFTLAEVLIAITVIGVIAAVTVPSIIQNTQKREYVTALQKTYSTLSQVTNQIITEEGSPKASEGGWASSAENIYNMYKIHLNNAKECKNESASNCFTQMKNGGRYKNLDGSIYTWNWGALESYNILVLADGSQILFDTWNLSESYDCSQSWGGSDNVCALIWADVNGAAQPNTRGRDMFYFVLKENGIYPAGCDKTDKNYCSTDDNGCACKVLREGAMNY